MNGWYSVQELAGLPGMPGTERGVSKGLQKFLPVARSKERGKGREYPLSCLPKVTQAALLAKELVAQGLPEQTAAAALNLPAPVSATPAPALPSRTLLPICHPADMSDRQRQVEGARKYVLAEVERLMLSAGCSREAAMHTLLTHAAAGMACAQVLHALRLARDGRGRKADAEQADGLPSTHPETLAGA